MARNLMTDASATQAASVEVPNADAGATPAAQVANPVPLPANEVLAGAFPQWNLLPATPFLRRVR